VIADANSPIGPSIPEKLHCRPLFFADLVDDVLDVVDVNMISP